MAGIFTRMALPAKLRLSGLQKHRVHRCGRARKSNSGIENALFYADNTRMLFADGQDAANKLIAGLKAMDSGGGGH